MKVIECNHTTCIV